MCMPLNYLMKYLFAINTSVGSRHNPDVLSSVLGCFELSVEVKVDMVVNMYRQ